MRKLLAGTVALIFVIGIGCSDETTGSENGGGSATDSGAADTVEDASDDAEQSGEDISAMDSSGMDTSGGEGDTSPSDGAETGADGASDSAMSDTAGETGGDTVDADTSTTCGKKNQPCCNVDSGSGTCESGLTCCSGVPLPPGETKCLEMCPVSDRDRKEDIEPVDRQRILEQFATLPVKRWKYRKRASDRQHIGPMAGQFRKTFGVGNSSEKYISLVDANGVTMAAVQALYRKVEKLERENEKLRKELDRIEQGASSPEQCRTTAH